MRPVLICDTECYINHWLIAFYDPALPGTQVCKFELFVDTRLDKDGLYDILSKHAIITFNGVNYDEPMLTLALAGASCMELKEASDRIIRGKLKWWQFYDHYNLDRLSFIDHIDIKEVLKGVGVSLKKYGGRLHCKKLQELPIDEAATLTLEQMVEIARYNVNDLTTTYAAYLSCKAAIDLRVSMSGVYGVDLRSKSDAQMAEAIIKSQIGFKVQVPHWPEGSVIKYVPPDFIEFPHSSYLRGILNTIVSADFLIDDKGSVNVPAEIKKLVVKIGSTEYQMGIGGLHSMEKGVHYKTCDEYEICDADVASYYPSLILICGMFPKQIGEQFLRIYKNVYDERLAAKARGDKVVADALKVTANGSFGKLGSRYSILYAPDLLLKVTLTGQLALLMLIDMLESVGIPVVSANTDGIVTLTPPHKRYLRNAIIALWEAKTRLKMEFTEYASLYSRDVNNYVAIKPNGELKTKGAFSPMSVEKDPHNHIAIDAAIAYLQHGTPVETTIHNCTDITKFVTVRMCNGGAVFKSATGELGERIGKLCRFYIARGEQGQLVYSTSGNKVPDSLGARPCMELPDVFPDDIDYDYYVAAARKHLTSLSIELN